MPNKDAREDALRLLRGRHFARLEDSFVEIFSTDTCDDCAAPIFVGSHVLKIPDDAQLIAHEIYPAAKPQPGRFHKGRYRCGKCLEAVDLRQAG